ncbi:DUF998 domain-containing protein [Streptomyces erythrochromogenes]|uniref:DUF998 domain-containing protein n=1 Tax=Streptomyces erythrochromogenes TaxID=285574 RepID=UPI0036CE4C5B
MRELTVTAPRRLVAGGFLWTSLVQIFIVNNLVVLPRASNHSQVAEVISALGLTRCALVEGTRFCSPWHEAATIAWIAGGVCLAAGSLLTAAVFPPDKWRNLAFGALTVSGLGLLSTGLNPYNVRPTLHLLSAGICFFSGGLGVLVLGSMLRQARRQYWGVAGMVCGMVSLVFTVLTALRPDVHVQGLFERVSVWPSLVWIIGTGSYFAVIARQSHRGSAVE